jgi:hypothetical protein
MNLPGDIRDPWAPAAKYAEDYYSGGNVVSDSRVRLSPHHLSNEDDSGFLTPDVVNPDVGVKEEGEEEEEEEGEGEGEGEDEFEDGFVKDDSEDMEPQDFGPEPDENDHLFNRLRSYTQSNPAVCLCLKNLYRGSRCFLGILSLAGSTYELYCFGSWFERGANHD